MIAEVCISKFYFRQGYPNRRDVRSHFRKDNFMGDLTPSKASKCAKISWPEFEKRPLVDFQVGHGRKGFEMRENLVARV